MIYSKRVGARAVPAGCEVPMQNRNTILRIVALSLLLYALLSLVTVRRELVASRENTAALALELSQLREEAALLEEMTEELDSAEAMERLARERLGMVMPGEKVFSFDGEAD